MSQAFGLSVIADRYAEAMYDLAESNTITEIIKNDLEAIANAYKDIDDLRLFLHHPLIQRAEKKQFLQDTFQDKVNPFVINLLKILLDKNRMNIVTLIAESYTNIYNKKHNIVIAEVITAVETNNDLQNIIKDKLSGLLKKDVRLSSKVDKDILGGVIVKVEGKIIDGSLKGRLESIKRQIV